MSAAVSISKHLPVLTNSALSCFRTCPREFQIRYIMLRRPRRASEAFRFGSFWHIGLNAWWGEPGDAAAKFEAALVAIRARAEEREEDADPFELVKAEELLLGYTARWGDEDYETLAVELPFDMPLVNPKTGAASKTYRVRGKIDAVARHRPTNRKRGVEHKTTSKDIGLGSDYWRRVSAMDPQISTYGPGARSAGHDIDDFLYDVVRKVALRPYLATPEDKRRYTKNGKLDARQHLEDETPEEFRLRIRESIAETPEKYFARGPIVRLEHDEREHAADTWQTAGFIREAENEGTFPRNPNSCERFNRLCTYFDVCSGMASLDDENLFRTAGEPHEELAEI